MKNRMIKVTVASCASLLLLASCSSDDDDGTGFIGDGANASASAGDQLDLSTYVAIGDSLTAGFADGTVYLDGQINSFPNILASSFALAGGGEFKQPLVNDNLGGLVLGGAPIAIPGGAEDAFETRLVLNTDTETPGPIRQTGTIPTPDRTTDIAPGGAGLVNGDAPFNNLGVPGARIIELASPALSMNPYYLRFASNPETSSVISDAVEDVTRIPTFFSFWAGNNDALGYATSGGVGGLGSVEDPSDTANITNPAVFQNAFTSLIGALAPATNTDIRGVVANIPAIEDIPFFTTVPSDAIELPAETAEQVSAGFEAYNGGIQMALGGGLIDEAEATSRTISFTAGNNGVLLLDESLTDLSALMLPNLRQATVNDSILLTASGAIGVQLDENPATTVGVSVPLGVVQNPAAVYDPASLFTPAVALAADAAVLTAPELALLSENIERYNTIIESAVEADSRLALYDAAAVLADLSDADGLSFGTGSISSEFVFGGGFSLDGVHPTAAGYAVIANGMLDAINAEFGSSLPGVDPNERTRIFTVFPEETDLSAP